jgi:hypothetical protein
LIFEKLPTTGDRLIGYQKNKFAGGKYKGRDWDDPRHVFGH